MPSAVFHRTVSKDYPTAVAGHGVYIENQNGDLTLDGSSGAAVSCLGHGHKAVIEAIVKQAQQIAFAHTSFFTSNPAEELARLLISNSPEVFSHVMFLSSGSEAIESAIKVARQYHVGRGDTQRQFFIARKYSYHGNTLGALSLGYNPARRDAFEPLLSTAFQHVSPYFYSRDRLSNETEDAYVDRLLEEIAQTVTRLGSESVAAVVVEPISGATLGAVTAPSRYFAGLRKLCDEHGCLLIYDEVMCGMGRAGTLHAWQSLGGIPPDLQTIGKGLGAGYQPISAIMVGSKVYESLKTTTEHQPFVSGHTYQGHSIGCAAALATQKVIVKDDLLTNVQKMGQLLGKKLQMKTPMFKEVRGLGLFQAVEFDTPKDHRIAPKVSATCLKNGAAVYLCSPAVDAILFAPPFIISEAEVDKLVDIFVSSVEEVIRDIPVSQLPANGSK